MPIELTSDFELVTPVSSATTAPKVLWSCRAALVMIIHVNYIMRPRYTNAAELSMTGIYLYNQSATAIYNIPPDKISTKLFEAQIDNFVKLWTGKHYNKLHLNQSINQSISQSINYMLSTQSINQSINKPIN